MKPANCKKFLSLLLCLVLTAATALTSVSCKEHPSAPTTSSDMQAVAPTLLGEGSTVFFFSVTDTEKKTTAFEIHTNQTTVGDALREVDLIADGDDGLYKTVNGITLDYEIDKKYWAFYVGGSYASEGVDTTKIKTGTTYAFRAE